jgi:Ca-activated chloride channel family protein
MKLQTAALLAVFGMGGSTAVAMGLPISAPTSEVIADTTDPKPASDPKDLSRFSDGDTLTVEARLGHSTLAKGANGETYLFAQVSGSESAQALSTPPLNLAIAIDRSGSMKGDRIANAIAAATGVVQRMRDGDSIAVISFDTSSDAVVPPTIVSAATRPSIEARIRAIRLGGDTCISCGLDRAMTELSSSSLPPERVSRIMLLSDGVTNHGVTDMSGMKSIASRVRDRGVAITTIGVDVDFDEKMMAAIAVESNGRHYFVATPSGLPSIFAQEFDTLLASVARDADMRVDLAPGVEVDQVFDRSFRREGTTVVVPFGTFGSTQDKTVLMKLRVPADRDGSQPVASVHLADRDLVKRAEGNCGGELALRVVSDGSAQADLDPFVAARLERSRTAQSLTEANLLFEQGRVDEARARLASQGDELKKERVVAMHAMPKVSTFGHKGGAGLGDDFDKQAAALEQAQANFGPAPTTASAPFGGGAPANAAPDSRQGKQQVRTNQQNATDLAF